MSAKKAGKVPLAHRIPTTAVPTLATTVEPASTGTTGTAVNVPQASQVRIVGSISMSASPLHAA